MGMSNFICTPRGTIWLHPALQQDWLRRGLARRLAGELGGLTVVSNARLRRTLAAVSVNFRAPSFEINVGVFPCGASPNASGGADRYGANSEFWTGLHDDVPDRPSAKVAPGGHEPTGDRGS